MRILWVTPQFPDPRGSGGQLHEFELLRAVAPRHEITILSTDVGIRPDAIRRVEELGVRVEAVPWRWPRNPGPRTRLTQFARLLLGAAPTIEVWKRRGQLPPLIDTLVAEERARPVDVVHVVLGDVAPVTAAARAPSALLLFDIYSRQTDLLLKDNPFPRMFRHHMTKRNALRYEKRWYRRAGALACVSPLDAEILSTMLRREVATILNPIPDDFFAPPEVPRSPSTVTVVGSFGWAPNSDAVRWMCDDIWPEIVARRPDARLCVVGRYGSDELRRTVERAGGSYLEDVEDIRPYYWEAAAIVAPLRMGSGTRNKVLHAMACGAPVVATPSAVEGMDVSGDHLRLASDVAGIADAVVEVLNDPAAAAGRARAAREIAARYSAAEAGRALEDWWASAAEVARTASPGASTPSASPVADHAPPGARTSIVVCTRDRPELLRRSLAGIGAAAEARAGTELIVVEQGPAFARDVVSDLGLDATVVSDRGVGVSRARNLGLRHAAGDVVLFTDDDCEVPLDWVARHAEAFADPDVVASCGPVAGLGNFDVEHDPVALPAHHRHGRPPWLIGHSSNMAVRRDAFLRVGGFDERIGPGTAPVTAAEDADLIVRLLRAGTVVSGTGLPVKHIDWRSHDDTREVLISYERGAGAWIGKLMRDEPSAAIRYARARVGLLRDRADHARSAGESAVAVRPLLAAFVRGMAAGIRLGRWPSEEAVPAEGRVPPRAKAM